LFSFSHWHEKRVSTKLPLVGWLQFLNWIELNWRIELKTYSTESRCVIGTGNKLFAGASVHLWARTFYRPGQWRRLLSLARSTTSIIFIATNTCLSRKKSYFVATKISLSQQTRICRDKTFVATNICSNKHIFFTTRVCRDKTRVLSREKYDCFDKTFVATKMILVAAPGSDTWHSTAQRYSSSKSNACQELYRNTTLAQTRRGTLWTFRYCKKHFNSFCLDFKLVWRQSTEAWPFDQNAYSTFQSLRGCPACLSFGALT